MEITIKDMALIMLTITFLMTISTIVGFVYG